MWWSIVIVLNFMNLWCRSQFAAECAKINLGETKVNNLFLEYKKL